MGIIGTAISKSEKAVEVKENSLLVMKFNNTIEDRGSKNPFQGFDYLSMKPTTSLGLNDILKAVKNATEDPNILGIYLENENIPAGLATIEEIRNALIKFKESGKFIVSYSNNYGHKNYYLSSVSNSIYINPQGSMQWTG